MAHNRDDIIEVPIDRQGRVVIPRQLRSALGDVPGTIRATRVEGGILLAQRPATMSVVTGDDGLPLAIVGRPVTNEEVLAAIDAERSER